ncbi:MAG: HD domain-containing protein [Nitrospirae bacterium]|nr:HD domain-containing protein [Nitrospirota bacterium]
MGTTRRVIQDEYLPLDAKRLALGTRLPFDIYSEENGTNRQLFSKGIVFESEAMQFLLSRGVDTVYVRSHEADALNAYLNRNTTSSTRKSFRDDPLEFRNATFFKEKYYQIDSSTLEPGTKIDFNLYFLQGIEYFHLMKASEEEPATVDAAVLEGERDIVIRRVDMPRYRKYLSRANASESAAKQSVMLKESSKIAFRELFEKPDNKDKVIEVAGNVENIISKISDDSSILRAMFSIRNNAFYVYTHSINVAVLSLALGSASGMTKDALYKLGIGAMFHDVGMSAISPEIIEKQGRLSSQEFAIYKAHVTEGEKILRMNPSIPEESIEAVLQHHEKLSGRGYPNRLKGDSIKPFGRIIAIADCFDSLITTCAYRPAYSPFDALSIIARDKDYDNSYLRYFVIMLGKGGKTEQR